MFQSLPLSQSISSENMVQKRQLAAEEYDVCPKHMKLEHTCDLFPHLQFTKEAVSLHSDKDEDCFFKPINEVDYAFISSNSHVSASSWASSTTSEEDLKSEPPIQTSDPYSYLLEHSPRKKVPIGPEHQANIPEWREHDEGETKFMGSCVIPMPKDHTIHDDETIVTNKTDCYCKIPGSRLCVRQHIKEKTDLLKESVGHKAFADLGFDNMGEVVAEKWSEDDEELFHEIVYSNPVSVGKNFWNVLAWEFSTRTRREIVGYYFNVFVLRKRAEQNRCDPMNADSDDDEWQGNDCSYDSISQRSQETDGDVDFQYESSCTSSDTAGTSKVNVNSHKTWAGNNDFPFEPLDSRVWDIGYFSCPRAKTDFLPTGSMIEEVFGVESWDFDVTDDNKSVN